MKSHAGRILIAVVAAALLVAACGGDTEPSEPEQLTIGVVTNNPNGMRNVAGFMDGMAELGYVEGSNLEYVFAGEPVSGDALRQSLANMVSRDVDLIFTAGTPTGVAAHTATAGTDIPVVFGVIADPIRAGVMDDLTRPGGNMTGVKTNPDQGRRLELLLEIAPNVRRVLVPFNPNDAAAAGAVEQIAALAPDLGVELVLWEAPTSVEVTALLEAVPAKVDAIFLVPDSVVNAHLSELLAVAGERRLPTSGPSTAQVEQGALAGFGFVHREAGVQAARLAAKVLKGADPGTLPVETTESFLAINLETAAQLGLDIPEAILRQAAIILRPGGV